VFLGSIAMTLAADQPLAAPADYKLYSFKKRCYAFLDAKKKMTTAYVTRSRRKLWEMPGWYRVAALSDDGEHFVTGYDGGNLIPLDYDRKMAMLTFYRQGKVFRTITLEQLVPDLSKLRRTASHYSWGYYAGVEKEGIYRVDTVDRGALYFDMKTGERVQ
jgi:hypothetical protein